ncbi:MAG: cytochrome C biogenesis protein [Thermoleophilaceae bacterium]|nr:cytochrome C biogenesis protein [Thermoleophilaceae bacterium]
MNAPLTLAFGAGLLATVNPCGLALLPGFLSLYLGSDGPQAGRERLLTQLADGFLVGGGVLSASFSAVFIAAGLIVSVGLRSFIELVPWLATVIGAGLLLLGLAMMAGRRVGLGAVGRLSPGSSEAGGLRRVAVFGVSYAIGSLSCTLAVFLAVIGQTLTAANPLQLIAVFAAYAAGSATVLIALSVSAALAKGALARGAAARPRHHTRRRGPARCLGRLSHPLLAADAARRGGPGLGPEPVQRVVLQRAERVLRGPLGRVRGRSGRARRARHRRNRTRTQAPPGDAARMRHSLRRAAPNCAR